MRNFCHSFKFCTLTMNFWNVWPRQINLMIRIENVLKTSLQDLLKLSWRRLENVLKMFWRCLEDIFPRRLENFLAKRLEDVWKTFLQDVLLKMFSRRLGMMSWRHLEDVLKTYPDEYISLDQDVLKTSSEGEDERRP